MDEQLKLMGERVRTLREIMEMSSAEVANKCNISEEDYLEFEQGQKDFSFSFLNNVAAVFGVDVLELMSGESPKLSTACVVKQGDGFDINRREAYDYKHLAYTFRGKLADPFMVTVSPQHDKVPELQTHEGQEFNYVVEGEMTFFLGEVTYILSEGDSIYFDSSVPHAMKANNDRDCRFLAIVMKKEC